jgi:hypothetical protein
MATVVAPWVAAMTARAAGARTEDNAAAGAARTGIGALTTRLGLPIDAGWGRATAGATDT